MRCPDCDAEFLLGQDTCEVCGSDLTFLSVPGPKQGRLHEVILQDPLSQLNAPRPILLQESESVQEAVSQMRSHRYGSVLVLNDAGELVGIFTERDVVTRLKSDRDDFSSVPLKDVMTQNPRTLQETDTIAQALNYMAVGGYRHIALVRDGKPVGFCSIRGILRYLSESALVDA